MLALCRRIAGIGFALLALALLPSNGWAIEATIDRPNQYPSPSVKQPAADDEFDVEYPWWENTLTGDWRGWRTALATRGVVFDIRYVPILMNNLHGGLDTGFVGSGPLGITTTIDTGRLFGHEGGTLFVDWEFSRWFNHRFPPDNVFDPTGSRVGVNTNFIESDVAELNQIAQLYYKQSYFDDRLAIAFGKMDANVDFGAINASGAFQNSIAMYTSTLNPFIPTYPNEATGVVISMGDEHTLVNKFGWFDGTTGAYNPATGVSGPDTGPRGPESFFDNGGDWLFINQTNLAWDLDDTRPGMFAAGAWLHTGLTATDGTDTAGVSDVPGFYVLSQQTLWSPDASTAADGGGIIWFGRFGWSDPHKNPVHWSLMTGVSATGVIADRPADSLGLMFAHSHFTDNPQIYQSQQRNGQPGPAGGSEMSVESYYLWQWTSWSYLQPGLMWIITPGGGDPAPLDDALLIYGLVGFEF